MSAITPTDTVIDMPFADALSERYLAYALSTIMARSLPDARDGLKPVHRRLMHAMRLLKLDPSAGYKKCARVVGDVIGKYHPHGDQAVYDALVRLAQDFSVRYPLIDGQGNFGNIDGDNAAAMRYTEARLTAVAAALMEGLDEDAVDFQPTYDGEEEEPLVLPGAFPNLLANGASGIAVGMATNIPPHNVGELVDGLQILITARMQNKDVTDARIMRAIPGPDFPTGGVIVESPEAIASAYQTGRGAIRVRARWEKEDLGRGQYQIVIQDIPYQVQKSRLIEKIAELINDRKLPILADIRDESTEELRLILEPKNRTVEADVLMESLFKLTELETRFNLNLNVITAEGRPEVLSLRQLLDAFLVHQQEVLLRRSRFRLAKIERRMEILSGYLIAYLNLDEVIRIIREEDDAKASLIAAFTLTDTQAEAILNMRLRALRKLEEMEIRGEHEKLGAEKADIEALLASTEMQWTAIGEKLGDIKKRFGPKTELGKRRTSFGEAVEMADIPLEAMIEREPITVVCSRRGWVRALRGHVADSDELKYKDGDEGQFRFHAQTTDKILMLSSSGRMYTLGADKLPGGRGFGEPIRLMVDMDAEDEIIALIPYVAGGKLFVASNAGKGFIADADNLIAMKRAGKQVLNLPGDARALICLPVTGDHVAVIGDNRKLLVFPVDELPTLGRGQGVQLQRYKDGGLSDAIIFTLADGLSWPMGGDSDRWRRETELEPWIGKRASAGRLPPMGFPRNNKFR